MTSKKWLFDTMSFREDKIRRVLFIKGVGWLKPFQYIRFYRTLNLQKRKFFEKL